MKITKIFTVLTFSANLGFLWNNLPLAEAILKAKNTGFDAVECHWPYNESIDEVNAALTQTKLPMLGLNTQRGNVEAGEAGLAAVPEQIEQAQKFIDEAITYAIQTKTANIHVMAGKAEGNKAHEVFVANLKYACEKAAKNQKAILIEPLNPFDFDGYFLSTTAQAANIIKEVGAPNLKIMFDCYHVQMTEGNVCYRLKKHLDDIGHIQFASVPDRGPPDYGELDYEFVFSFIKKLNYTKPLGAEYKVGDDDTDNTLAWLTKFKQST